MNIAILVADSLSYRVTSFAGDGPDATPQLGELAENRGVVFDAAYAPGPLSPSSHASMFTGRLPSEAGMYEAQPYFDGDVPTLAELISPTHENKLVSVNMWLFQGLDQGFDETTDFTRQYLSFRDASDPLDYFNKYEIEGPWPRRLLKFAAHDGKPIRSLLNYMNYRWQNGSGLPKAIDGEGSYQYAEQINSEVRTALKSDADTFVFANYMDIHPPFNASEEALERFAADVPRSELPIGVSPERHIENDEKSYDPELMEQLYRAAVWDFDRKLAPLVEDLLAEDMLVVVVSDHGIWNRDTAYSENRLHVPLVIFAPEEQPRHVKETVSLQSLPKTILEAVDGPSAEVGGQSLLDVSDDRLAVTEIIHHPNEVYEKTGRVDVTKTKTTEEPVQRDLVLTRGDAQIQYLNGTWSMRSGSDSDCDNLRARGEEILQRDLDLDMADIEYDAATQERLENLGYM
jgi:arylsulfatase A-like enzyme